MTTAARSRGVPWWVATEAGATLNGVRDAQVVVPLTCQSAARLESDRRGTSTTSESSIAPVAGETARARIAVVHALFTHAGKERAYCDSTDAMRSWLNLELGLEQNIAALLAEEFEKTKDVWRAAES